MNKYLLLMLIIFVSSSACKTIKKTQTQSPVINAETVTIKDANSKERTYATSIYNKLKNQKINFQTFSSKLSLSIESSKLSQSASGNLRIEKDKRIWISVTGPFGIEVFRALITPDSIRLLDKLQNKVVYRNISYIQQIIKLPLDFYDLQDLLMGNAILTNGELVSYKSTEGFIQLFLKESSYTNTVTIQEMSADELQLNNFKIQEISGNRNSQVFYMNYSKTGDQYFPLEKSVQVNDGNDRTHLQIQYKEPVFNQPLTFPFNVPGNFSRD